MTLRNVQLSPQLIQAVRDAVDVVDIASEHTRLRKAGRRHQGLCPLHKEKTPSFSVDPDQGLFYCFGCGQGGDAIQLHMKLSGDDFPAAIESLARRYGIPLPTQRAARHGRDEEPDLEGVLEAAAEFYRHKLSESAGPLKYLRDRRIGEEIIEQFGLGYAPEAWRELIDALHPKISLKELEAAGLVTRNEKAPGGAYDRFRNRLIFPIRNPAGRLVGFGGRTLGDDKAKYINTSETSRFHKSRILYGLDLSKRAIRESGRAVLVEGYFDVIGVAASGVEGAVAGMGTSLTEEQTRLLNRFAGEVIVGYDGDEAGEKAFHRALPLLLRVGLGVRRALFGEGHDPDSLRLEKGEEAVRQAIEESADAVLLELERRIPEGVEGDPRRQSKAAHSALDLLRSVKDTILRYSYAREAAGRLGLPLDLLWKQMAPRGKIEEQQTDEPPPAKLVRSLEERVLQLLMVGPGEIPPPDELPEPEAFLDPVCRNIFEVFSALYEGGDGRRPDAKSVVPELGVGPAVDRAARLLVEDPVAASAEELERSLRQLERRLKQQRIKRLAAEIGAAQRAGDGDRLERLLSQKTALSRSLHRQEQG